MREHDACRTNLPHAVSAIRNETRYAVATLAIPSCPHSHTLATTIDYDKCIDEIECTWQSENMRRARKRHEQVTS